MQVVPGDTMLISEWGGQRTLRAIVRAVEPSAFTKVSALGIEEQRVNVRGDFLDRPEGMGDGYRVEVGIVVDRADEAIRAPLSALFREGEQWAAYLVRGGRARRAAVAIGRRGGAEAEVLSGLSEGDTVIRFPSDQVGEGTRVKVRKPR